MKPRSIGWITAILVSGAVHAGAAAVILHEKQKDEAKIAGGGAIEVALAGNAFADQVSAGADMSVVEPVTDAQEETTPVEAEATAPEAVEAAAPVPPSETAAPTDIAAAQAPAAVEAQLSQTETASVETAQSAPETDVALATAAPARNARQAPSPAQPAEPVTPTAKATEPAEPTETVAALADIPVPTPRPDYEPPRVRKQAPEPQEARKAPARKQAAGSGGRNQADTRRGTASGTSDAQETRQGERRTQTASLGNADISNYRGKVHRRLSRALRYPAEARRRNLRGEVFVRFVITANGGVGRISVIRSSGSPVLDNAAIATVKRAAPFPPIPDGAGRSTWSFDAPLSFTR